MKVKDLVTVSAMFAGTTALIMGCSGGGSGSSPSTTNPLANLSSDITTHMSSAIPTTSASLAQGVIRPKAAAAWDTQTTHMKRPGCSEAAASLKQFTLDLLDSDYECDDYTPSIFGRFSQTMVILQVVGDNIDFENGAPKMGMHTFTEDVPVEGGTFPVDFSVTVAAVTSDYFDVKINVTGTASGETMISGNTIYFKNRNNQTNIIASEDNGDNRLSWDVLYWNRSTGAMTYTYASRDEDTSAAEVQKIVIQATGESRVGHSMHNAGDNVFFTADFANGADSTEGTVGFRQSGMNLITGEFCVDVSDLSAVGGVCGSAPDIDDWVLFGHVFNKSYNDMKVLFGANEAALMTNVPDFSLTNFHTID
ncbi:hypothetical protein [Bdellovibrio bacteriovorus]|uniref:Lipoprotein n=1 Tax=Bdellovibrio bacteriovorus TaxID=959 RepID=A0A1Z3NA82_BDEBC|nr:hypothetical protein [Bdellovibrio bacteriovorus]ASD64357.1 hypothetical protein B9G79_12665 [Bdellovibrio bacteriovorus]